MSACIVLILILPDQVCGYIGKHNEVTKHSHNGSYLENSNMQLRHTISIRTLISLCTLNLTTVYRCTNFKAYEQLSQFYWPIISIQAIAVGRELLSCIVIPICKRHGTEQLR